MQERQRSWAAVWVWTSCRVQASFHVRSVTLEWAATASSSMAASTGCTRNAVGSSTWLHTDYRCTWCQGTARPLDGRPQKEVQVRPEKLEVVASFCYLGDMLSAAGGCELSTTTNRLEEVQGSATSSLFTPSLFQNMWPWVQLLCAERNAPCLRDLATDKAVCSEMTGQWSDRSAMLGRKTLSPPGPMSYLCGLALRIWTSFWRREDSDGIDMWNTPMVQSRQPLTYMLMESMGLGGPRWHGSSWQRGMAESGSSRLSTLMIDIPGYGVRSAMHAASQLSGRGDSTNVDVAPCTCTLIKNPIIMMMMISIFSSGSHFVQRSGTILEILVKGHERNISVKLFWNRPLAWEEMLFKVFFLCLVLAAILFCRAEPFSNFGKGALEEHFCEIILKLAHWPGRICLKVFLFLALAAILFCGTIQAILVEGHLRNIPVKLFQNPFSGLGGDIVLRFFYV